MYFPLTVSAIFSQTLAITDSPLFGWDYKGTVEPAVPPMLVVSGLAIVGLPREAGA